MVLTFTNFSMQGNAPKSGCCMTCGIEVQVSADVASAVIQELERFRCDLSCSVDWSCRSLY